MPGGLVTHRAVEANSRPPVTFADYAGAESCPPVSQRCHGPRRLEAAEPVRGSCDEAEAAIDGRYGHPF